MGYRRNTRCRRAIVVIAAATAAALLAGCTTFTGGRAVSMLYDPFRVGGLPATDGPSGVRDDAPVPTGAVRDTNGGDDDKLALLSVNDLEDFWKQTYSEALPGHFSPVRTLVSFDSTNRTSPRICGVRTYRVPNAFFTSRCNLIAWDRGSLLPAGRRYFGDVSIPGLLAHEYGHALQRMAKLVDKRTPTIVFEQQADCFAGVYNRWLAEGKSPRFVLSTGDGLDHVLAGAITSADPVMTERDENDNEHGSALDRVSAFQMGFVDGATACTAIDLNEIDQRRGDLPTVLQADPAGVMETGEVPINRETLSTLMGVLGVIFSPQQPPALSYDRADCPDAQAGSPASYCPATNTITVDLPELQKLGTPADRNEDVLPQGDDTALSVVMSRYALAVQREHGLPLGSAAAALRSACLTGVAHRRMAEPIPQPDGNSLVLTAGDVDEAVAGLLTNRMVASDVNGATVPAGFTRITAFRSGVGGDDQLCYARFHETDT
jgi:predicted metalloprotease